MYVYGQITQGHLASCVICDKSMNISMTLNESETVTAHESSNKNRMKRRRLRMFIWKAWKRVVSITLTIILALCMFPLAEAEEQPPLVAHRVQLGDELLEVLECDEEALMSGNYPDSTTQYS